MHDCFSQTTRRQLEQIASDVRFIGSRLFQVANDLPEMVSSEVTSYPNQFLENALVKSLTQALYLRYYCGLRTPNRSLGTDLCDALRKANASTEGWDTGW